MTTYTSEKHLPANLPTKDNCKGRSMTTLRKCFRALGMMADAFSISFAAAVAFLSAHLAIYCFTLVRDGWQVLAFPVRNWDQHQIVLAWFQGALMTGQGPLIMKTWGVTGHFGFFCIVAVLAAHDALLKLRSRMG